MSRSKVTLYPEDAVEPSREMCIRDRAEATLALGEGTRLNVLFPVANATPGPEAEAKAAAKPVKVAGRAAKAASKPVVSGGDSPHTETLKRCV